MSVQDNLTLSGVAYSSEELIDEIGRASCRERV